MLLALCIHILAVIAFVGYIFFDVFIYKSAYKTCGEKTCEEVRKGFTKRGGLVLGISFLAILISGYYLLSFYGIASLGELFSSTFGVFLCLKLFLLAFMIFLTFYSIFFIRVLKKPDPFNGRSHIYALFLCVIIVILAVLMTRL